MARAALIAEVSKGRHTGTKATMNDLFDDWTVELQRKGRSPNLYGEHQRPGLSRSVPIPPVLVTMLSEWVDRNKLTDPDRLLFLHSH